MDTKAQRRWILRTGWLNVVFIDEDELFEISRMVYAIKQHLKKHFDLWGDNQPWHMFDKLHLKLALIAQQKTTGDTDEAQM